MLLSVDAPLGLADLEPTAVWAVFQLVESRYALVSDGSDEGAWIAAGLDEEAGAALLLNDAEANGRPIDLYRLDELSLPDLMAEARAIPVPVRLSTGFVCDGVEGLALYETQGDRVILSECVGL